MSAYRNRLVAVPLAALMVALATPAFGAPPVASSSTAACSTAATASEGDVAVDEVSVSGLQAAGRLAPADDPDGQTTTPVYDLQSLKVAVQKAGSLNQDQFTPASWSALLTALQQALVILADTGTPAQADIQSACTALRAAISNLETTGGLPHVGLRQPSTPTGPQVATYGEREIVDVTVSQSVVALMVGDTLRLAGAAYDVTCTPYDVKWKSSKKSVATVSAKGLVTAKKAGKATITAYTPEGKKAKVAVRVYSKRPAKAKVTSIVLEGYPGDGRLLMGRSLWLTARPKPASAIGARAVYKSTKPQVATVEPSGRVLAVGSGSTTIKVTAGGVTQSIRVVVP
jgi:YD repeat-containing protein